jgi:hypothetical protein
MIHHGCLDRGQSVVKALWRGGNLELSASITDKQRPSIYSALPTQVLIRICSEYVYIVHWDG